MARTPAPNGRKAGKETLASVMATLGELTPSEIAAAVIEGSDAPRELLSAYANASRKQDGSFLRPNLPPADVLRAIADYVDARIATLRPLLRRLRSQAKRAEKEASDK